MAKQNYRKMYEKPEAEQIPVPAPETVDETPVSAPEPEPTVTGVVTGCGKLNIRKEPSTSAAILCEVANKSELIIDLDKSTDEWYSVCTPAGIEGFCMKQFVVLA